WVAGEWPETNEGKAALESLIVVLESADLEHISDTFDSMHAVKGDSLRPIVPVLLQRERESPKHPCAAKLLTEFCLFLAPDNGTALPDQFGEIADVIVERHAKSPKLANFCELLGGMEWSPPWAAPFEPHLRRILEVNEDRFVRCSAKIALASIIQESGEDRQSEAAELFEEFLTEFDGKVKYHASSIEEMYREVAKRELKVIVSHGLGAKAPETIGLDLNGEKMALADYQGKVVLITFWATWCSPCMRMIPNEKALLKHFGKDGFAIVGVNSDTKVQSAREAVKKHEIPWRSFQNSNDGQNKISSRWRIPGYPTFYLLDSNGIVRKRWFGEQAVGVIAETIVRLMQKVASQQE
ncbi:MAG: TlpA family protein disulfide reductase, partial [Planctomycetales bacterium]|nr:TlpA family protein disulfide reductase [Planctomycetales bacterium]